MNIMKWTTLTAAAFGLLLSAASTQAALLSFEDDDIEYHLDSDLNLKYTDAGGGADFAVGDVIVSVFEIPIYTIDGANAIPTGQELTGVAAIQIVSIEGNQAGDDIVFAPYSGGLNSVLALGTDPDAVVPGGGAGEGAMLAMWFNGTDGVVGDTNLDVNRSTTGLAGGTASCTDLADCINQASLGDLFQVDGFVGDPDEFWVANLSVDGGANSDDVANSGNTNIVASFNAGVSNFFQDGFQIGYIDVATNNFCGANNGPVADGCVQAKLSGTVTGGNGLENDGFAHSDFDAAKYTVPEPSILGLLGIGLMGIFLARRRQRA